MGLPKATDEQVFAALKRAGWCRQKAATLLGMTHRSVQGRVAKMRSDGRDIPDPPPAKSIASSELTRPRLEFDIPTLPDGRINVSELIERRKRAFERRDIAAKARALIPVKVRGTQPIGICMLGDPHVDDDGTDLARLESDIRTINATPGLYAACVGDLQNNWVGRLARLYGNQETTASQAWQLVEWFVHELSNKWLFMVQGNHDHWSGSGDPLRWIQRQAGVDLTGEHTVRIALRFPNDVEVRIAARHDWPGNSMWNPSHGQLRAAHLTHHDHVIVSGHRHSGGYQLLRIPATGMLAHLVQLGSYKIHDDYADALGFPNKLIAPSATAIIDPRAGELGLVRIEHDLEAAADYLTWARARRAA